MIAQLEAMLRDAVKKYEECDEVIHDAANNNGIVYYT